MLKRVINVKMDTLITKDNAINVLKIVNGAITQMIAYFVMMIDIWITQLDCV